MKELSIEEKARAYDKALAIAKEQLNGAKVFDYDNEQVAHDIRTTVYNIFPELKESEDEQIRKEDEDVRKWLISQLETKSDVNNSCELELMILKSIAWLEKQGKQNVDKVEPKFNVGDWIVSANGKVNQVISVDADNVDFEGYTLDDGVYFSGTWCNSYHLWTIEDAKEGDMLCTYKCDEPKIIFILQGTVKKYYALRYYCYYNIMYSYFEPDSETGCLAPNEEDIKPATKEQRDTLFAKIKESGYEWDAVKKQLKEIEK